MRIGDNMKKSNTHVDIKFPSPEKLRQRDEKLKKVKGTLMVGPSSTPSEKFRWKLCQNLLKYMVKNNMNQSQFADFLGIDQSRISEIVHHRIDKVSTDKLISYNEKIDPSINFKIV
jgi:predicted XRE-type DNA-binding protein